MDRAVFGRERIDVGAYEATLLADASFRHRAELFLPRSKGLLVCEAARHPSGACADPRPILHL